jgi:Uma2 family endonuclease
MTLYIEKGEVMATIPISELPNYTYDEYKLWEGNWELIYGLPYAMSPAPLIEHQRISNNIAWQLKSLLENCSECQALLPVDWKIDEQTVVQPDNMVICDEPEHDAYLTKAPVVIFEILSRSTANKDRTTKYHLYEREGVRYYIIVNPADKMAKVYKLNTGKYLKVKDLSSETTEFELGKCNLKFDFSKIW